MYIYERKREKERERERQREGGEGGRRCKRTRERELIRCKRT
jgi:hypothetical protein